MNDKKSMRLGEMLIGQEIITFSQLEQALREQKKSGDFLGAMLIKLGFTTEEKLLPVLSKQLNIEYVKLRNLKIDPSLVEKISAKFVCHYKLVPVELKDNILKIAVTDPLDIHTLDDVKLLLGYQIDPVLAGEKDILEAIRKYYGVGAETVEKMTAGTLEEKQKEGIKLVSSLEKTEDIGALAGAPSIVKFFNEILLQAYHDRATDIHIEPYEDEIKVRYRIDGILYDIPLPPNIRHFQSAIISRVKIMANLNIAERRLPQDGRIRVKIGDNDVDIRVSILPTSYGESVDIRLLASDIFLGLEKLGFSQENLAAVESMLEKPHGIIFVTGPTGSGKTTTLYACLSKVNDSKKKIITIEDPVEYHLKGIIQVQIAPKIELTFAKGLRSMLRHDPDIMMVGEVRDMETAEITIRVALTGHLVFSTLHTNDAPSAITRLIDMGIEPFLISSSVECFIAQRLVRLVCPKCKEEVKPQKEIIEKLVSEAENISKVKFFEGKGCENCKFTGYKGRTAIHEILIVNDRIRRMMLSRASADEIRAEAVSCGMRTLRWDGWLKVANGLTTPAEVLRVT